ncbi:MAG: Arc family DNA-binding protein [Gemmatimonadetes bacterium]|nr:Arc family DNA-binding protein [Gemmatimonadota bacterium]
MTNLTIKSLPDDLHDGLKKAAARNRRSLNAEVIQRLEASLGAVPLDVEQLLERAQAVRERAPLPYLTDAALRVARDEGRA